MNKSERMGDIRLDYFVFLTFLLYAWNKWDKTKSVPNFNFDSSRFT